MKEYPVPDVETTTNAHLLSELIGDKAIAQRLIKEYGSLTNLACASIDELCRYHGFVVTRRKVLLSRVFKEQCWTHSPEPVIVRG